MIVESFGVRPGVGLPLGNLSSQLFANIYLHELDWYCKHTLRIRHYLRYCDDFILLVEGREEAWELVRRIDDFLRITLHLQLHPNKVHVRTWKQGIDFLGYVLLPEATILRPQTAQRAVRGVSVENLHSYAGLCRHANAFELSCLLKNKVGSS